MKIIQISGNSKLVEYINSKGNYKRCTLPVDSQNVKIGIPYGVPFERFIKHKSIPNELRKRGIWTVEDLEKNRAKALGAIQAAYAQDLATIIKLAKEEVKNNG